MQTKEIANLPVYEEINFFIPLLQSTRKLLDALEFSENSYDTKKLNCNFAPAQGKIRKWEDIHLVREEWHFFRQYFMGKSPLLYFWEPPLIGLVNKEPALWVFAKVDHLKGASLREKFKLNKFYPKAVKSLPFQNIERHFQKELSERLMDKTKVFSIRAQECEKYLKLATEYLPKKQALEVHHLVRVLLKVGLQIEVEDLVRILDENILVDLAFLKKRIRAVHTLSMKYYFARASDEQKRKLDSLVGRDKGHQHAALVYLERIIARSFQSLVNKK